MEAGKRAVIRYAAVAVFSALVAGALVFAITPSREELSRLGAERDALKTEASTLMARLGTLEGEQRSLQKQNAGLAADADRVRASLTEKDRAYEELQQRNRALVIENESLAKKLAGSGAKVAASAAEREQLARKLAVTGKGLEEARSRAAQLNSSYEALLKEQKKRAASDAARDAELERTKKALEAAQEEVARLTGARGIYTVQTGDHLSKIAAFFYHKAHRWPDIFEANSFLISSPDLIYPQQVLIIPR